MHSRFPRREGCFAYRHLISRSEYGPRLSQSSCAGSTTRRGAGVLLCLPASAKRTGMIHHFSDLCVSSLQTPSRGSCMCMHRRHPIMALDVLARAGLALALLGMQGMQHAVAQALPPALAPALPPKPAAAAAVPSPSPAPAPKPAAVPSPSPAALPIPPAPAPTPLPALCESSQRPHLPSALIPGAHLTSTCPACMRQGLGMYPVMFHAWGGCRMTCPKDKAG